VTFSVKLLQNTGKNEGKKYYWYTVFLNSFFLGQTITDCVSKQMGKIQQKYGVCYHQYGSSINNISGAIVAVYVLIVLSHI
jgi:hypothetical protein